jgi:hypothetical protein
MCLLIAMNGGADVTDNQLERAAWSNPDGFGWAIHTGEHLIRFRSMNIDDAITEWRFVRKMYPDQAAIWHLRWATHGTVDVSNCHPFEVGHDARMMIAHNGVLPIDAENGRSDTRILAEDRLSRNAVWVDDEAKIAELETWLGGNKVAILSSHPRTSKDLYILNEDQGDWEGGVWFSNDSHKPAKLKTVTLPVNAGMEVESLDDDIQIVTCDVCQNEFLLDMQDEHADHNCPDCQSCYWCGAGWCMCYTPDDTMSDEMDLDHFMS